MRSRERPNTTDQHCSEAAKRDAIALREQEQADQVPIVECACRLVITTGLRSGSVYAFAIQHSTQEQTAPAPSQGTSRVYLQVQWQHRGNAPVFSSPLLSCVAGQRHCSASRDSTMIIVCNVHGHITALEGGTGQPLWQQQAADEVMSDGIFLARSVPVKHAELQDPVRTVAIEKTGAIGQLSSGQREHALGVILLPTGCGLVAVYAATGTLLAQLPYAAGCSGARLHALPASMHCSDFFARLKIGEHDISSNSLPSSPSQQCAVPYAQPPANTPNAHNPSCAHPCLAVAVMDEGTIWLLQPILGALECSNLCRKTPSSCASGECFAIGRHQLCSIKWTTFSGAVPCSQAGCIALGARNNCVFAVDMLH
jgi:hypothetical protein